MMENLFVRGAMAVGLVDGVLGLLDRLFSDDIQPHRIYNTVDVARFLNMERLDVIRLLNDDEIKGRRVGGNFRVPGASILEYLAR